MFIWHAQWGRIEQKEVIKGGQKGHFWAQQIEMKSTFILGCSTYSSFNVFSAVRLTEEIIVSSVAIVVDPFPPDLIVIGLLGVVGNLLSFPPLVALPSNGLVNGGFLATPSNGVVGVFGAIGAILSFPLKNLPLLSIGIFMHS